MAVSRVWLSVAALGALAALVVALNLRGSEGGDAPVTPRAASGVADRTPPPTPAALDAPIEARRPDGERAVVTERPAAGATPSADRLVEPAPPEEPPTSLGAAGRANPIFGGTEAIAAFHEKHEKLERVARLEAIDAVLAQYVSDPKDPLEFEQYQALKYESLWLTTHLEP